MRALLVPAVLTALLLTGCSDDGEPGSRPDSEVAVASVKQILAGNDATGAQDRAGTCLADAIVEGAGTDALVEAGVLDADLTPSEEGTPSLGGPLAEVYVDALLECRDVSEEFAARRSLYPDLTDAEAQEYVDCAAGIDPEVLRPALLASLTGVQDKKANKARQKYVEALGTCEEILGSPTTPN